ncbi:carbohydrate kinase family protein [Paenibacillus alkalitolerans]|uniref:carbohydrate kinase family protein n=1 Tax=Paenibacillus alkalitolerans TaxID=2799335 RepID=UPI0018F4F677|nr:carbohydrate kinase family protein [Paenibacillus alkalitolerans]
MPKFDSILVGAACCDIIFNELPSMPKPGEEIWAKGLLLTVGGMMNSAASLSRLGKHVGLVTAYGSDLWGDIIESKMLEEGVSTALAKKFPGPYPQVTVSLNHQDDRAMVSYGDSGKVSDDFKSHLLSVIRNCDAGVYHFSAQRDYSEFIREAKNNNRTVSLDAVWDEEWLKSEGIRNQIRQSDIFLPNLKEAQTITGKQDPYEALELLAEMTPLAVVKLGKEGAIAKFQGQIFHAAGFPADSIDLTGAGDCFIGGFLYGWLNGKPIEQCLIIANYCGSRCVQSIGGYSGAPLEQHVVDALQDI